MNNIEIGDIIIFREGHKNEGQPGKIEAKSETGSFNIRMPNGTLCGAYPEDIYKIEEKPEPKINNNSQTMYQDESKEILKSKGFKITIAIIIIIVTVLYFRGPSKNIEVSPIDQKIQDIANKELSKSIEYKIQKESRDKQREQDKIEKESIQRVKNIDLEINKKKKEIMDLIK